MFSLSHARDKMKTSFSKNRYVIITFAPERPRMIMPRDKDCHPLQSIQLIPYVHLRSEGEFTRNLLKSGEKIAQTSE